MQYAAIISVAVFCTFFISYKHIQITFYIISLINKVHSCLGKKGIISI